LEKIGNRRRMKGKEKIGKREEGYEIARVEKGNPVLSLSTKRGYLGQTIQSSTFIISLFTNLYYIPFFRIDQYFMRPILYLL
jgi:hypothetical protein